MMSYLLMLHGQTVITAALFFATVGSHCDTRRFRHLAAQSTFYVYLLYTLHYVYNLGEQQNAVSIIKKVEFSVM